MFRIGEFSRFSRVSVKMLRHYDHLNLLPPAYIDPDTGYRYYSADQLPRLNRIVALKDVGLSLEQIGEILDGDLKISEIQGMLKLKQVEISQRLREDQQRLLQIDHRLAHLQHEAALPHHEIVLRSIAPQAVAAIRATVGFDGIPPLFEQLETYVAEHNARLLSPPQTIYHDAEYRENQQDVEVIIPITHPIPEDGPVHVYTLAGQETMACAVYVGSYDTSDHVCGAMLSWIEKHHYRVIGPTREVYLRFGAANEGYTLPAAYLSDIPGGYVTEMQIPVGEAAQGATT